jgi:predicted small secreted protein
MRRIVLVTLAAAGLALGACSRDTTKDVEQNVEQAGSEIKEGAQDVINDPDVREAGGALKQAVKDGGTALKDVAVEAGDAVRDAKAENDAETPPADKATNQ